MSLRCHVFQLNRRKATVYNFFINKANMFISTEYQNWTLIKFELRRNVGTVTGRDITACWEHVRRRIVTFLIIAPYKYFYLLTYLITFCQRLPRASYRSLSRRFSLFSLFVCLGAGLLNKKHSQDNRKDKSHSSQHKHKYEWIFVNILRAVDLGTRNGQILEWPEFWSDLGILFCEFCDNVK